MFRAIHELLLPRGHSSALENGTRIPPLRSPGWTSPIDLAIRQTLRLNLAGGLQDHAPVVHLRRGLRMEAAAKPSLCRWEQMDGSGGHGGVPGDVAAWVEVRRGGRDGHGAASRRRRDEGKKVGSVGGGEGGEEVGWELREAPVLGLNCTMTSKREDKDLRRKLQAMTEACDLSEYLELFRIATVAHTTSVRIVESAHPIAGYTCFVHAFGFTEKSEYTAIAKRGFNVVFAGGGFAHWLIERGLLQEVAESEATAGDLVIYFDDQGQAKHAGVYVGGSEVESKWGLGHLFRHGIFEVPEPYGTRVRFFKRLDDRVAINSFVEFARELGMFLD